MSTLISHTPAKIGRRVLLAAFAVATALAVALSSGHTDIVRKAAGIGDTATGLEKFVSASDALITPATIAIAAIAPLACIVGAGALMFGNRKGGVIIGSALGTLVFVASIKGIVA
jgi:hypothetical protein